MDNLYFDIDGVLNTEEDWKLGVGRIHLAAVENFCKLVKEGYTPILTSSWRTGFIAPMDPQNSPQIKDLERELGRYGIRIAGKVPDLNTKSRDELIEYYQKRHPSDDYLILDDDKSEYRSVNEHNYFTDHKKGLTKEDLAKIRKTQRTR